MNAPANPSQEYSVPAGVLEDVPPDIGDYPAKLPDFGTIGDDYASHGMAMNYLSKIGQESKQDSEPYIEQAAKNAKVYQWGEELEPQADRVIANDIQSAVIAITDIQTRDAYSIFIRPVQTRDKPQVFWIGPPVDANLAMLVPGLPIGLGMEPVLDPMTGMPAMQQAMDPMTGQPAMDAMGQPVAEPVMQEAQRRDTPLDEITAWQLQKLLQTGAFPAEWMFRLDDKSVADVYQTTFDTFWKQDKLDEFVWENQLKTNVYGYQTSYYQWDPDAKKHIVRDVSIRQARLDPNADGSNFELQNDPGFEVVYDVDEAKAKWPQVADLIEQYAREGSPNRTDSYSDFGVASNRQFQRRTVTFLVHWFRNQKMPMTPEEAMGAGHVYDDGAGNYRSTQVQEQSNATLDGANGSGVAEDAGDLQGVDGAGARGGSGGYTPSDTPQLPQGNGGNPSEELGAGNIAGAAGGTTPPTASPAIDGGIGESGLGGIAAPVSGPGVSAVAPPWPTTTGIRQVATIAQTYRIVQDIRCEHWDIPMLLNVCIPLPSRPYGQGLPEKLRGLQQADIRLLNAVVEYAETFANPGSMIPVSVADALKQGMNRTFVRPNETLKVPDHLIEKWGEKAVIWFQPPPLPPAVAQVMQMLDQRTKETSGHPEVMQGVAPSPTSSGKMIEALQSGAAGQFGFQAKSTLRNVERLANLMHYTHLWRLTLEDMCDINRRIPREIMQLVMDRAQKSKWDNTVDANGTAGGARNKKLQEALAMFQAVSVSTGEPAMPLGMLREVAGIDDEEASLRYRQELQTAAPAPGMAPGQPPQPGQPQPPEQQDQTQEIPQ